MKKINYFEYKRKEKRNIIENKDKTLALGNFPTKNQIFEDKTDDMKKLVLTKIGKKEGDSVEIYCYDPDGDIRKTQIEFDHFKLDNKKWYKVKISWVKENNFLKKLRTRNFNEGYWRVLVTWEKNDIDIRGDGTDGSNDTSMIMDDLLKSHSEKVVEIINKFGYTKVKRNIPECPFSKMGGDE